MPIKAKSEAKFITKQTKSKSEADLDCKDIIRINTRSQSRNSSLERSVGIEGTQNQVRKSEHLIKSDMAPVRNPENYNAATPVDEWIQRYNQIATVNGWNDEQKLLLLPLYLEGTPASWYEMWESQERRNVTVMRAEIPRTWEMASAAMRKAFDHTIPDQQHWQAKLNLRIQGESESLQDYALDVLRLCDKVDRAMPESTKARHILEGILPSLQDKLLAFDNPNVETILENIKRIERGKYGEKRRLAVAVKSAEYTGTRYQGYTLKETGTEQKVNLTNSVQNSDMDDIRKQVAELTKITKQLAVNLSQSRVQRDRNIQEENQTSKLQQISAEETEIAKILKITTQMNNRIAKEYDGRNTQRATVRDVQQYEGPRRTADSRIKCFTCKTF